MLISEFFSGVQEKIFDFPVHIASDADFSGIGLLGGKEELERSTLYFGHLSQLPENFGPSAGFVLCGASELPKHLTEANCLLASEEQLPAVFSLANHELTQALRMENEYAALLKMILDGKSLSAILDIAEERLDNPLAVLDISGKVIAHSANFDVPDPLWIESAQRGYCPYAFMEHVKKVGAARLSPNSSDAFVTFCEQAQLTYLCSKILDQGALLGYVFLFQARGSVTEKARELLPLISRAAGEMILHLRGSEDLRVSLYRNILSDMLEGIDAGHANVRIQVCNLEFPPRMCVLVLRPSYYHGGRYLREQLLETAQRLFPHTPALYYQNSIVLIAPLDELYRLEEKERERLVSLAEREHLQIGMSNAFSEPSKFAAYHAQADEALRLAQRLGQESFLHQYQDYAFFSLLGSLPIETQPGRFCHPALGRLRKYDHENGTELYRTLKTYTETGLSQRRTAEVLFLHRNTLNYRMRRIEEIGGIDLEDPQFPFLLMYSFQIDRYLENNTP